jgi:arylsulfatase A-like enzyme
MTMGNKMMLGFQEGALWGLAFFGLEEVFSFALKQPGLSLEEALFLLPIYMFIPAFIGASAARLGAKGLTQSWVIWGGMAAFLLGGKFAHILAERALPGMVGFPIAGIGVAIGVWIALRLSRERPSLRWGGLIAAWLLAVGGLTANLGALASPTSTEALVWDASIAICAGLIGLVAARQRAPDPRKMALFLAIAAWGLRGPAALWSSQAIPDVSKHTGPPIVMIVVDTLRADHLGIGGHTTDTSPNIDALAQSGWIYTQATSASSWTLPATASLLTGRIPSRHGAGANLGTGNSNHGLNATVPTLAEVLRKSGYTTAGIVSNPWLKRLYGLSRGFSYYDDALGLGHNPLILQPLDMLGVHILQDRYYTPANRQVNKALDFVNSQGDNGWFLFLHLMDPHGPYNPPAHHLRGKDSDFQDPVQRQYDAEIRFVDAELKRLFAALPETAWVVLTSDHGEEFGEHPQAYSNQPIPDNTRHGHTLYQEVVHVPLLLRPPGGQTGLRVDTPVASLDLAETLAKIGGTSLGEDADAQELAEVLGKGSTISRPILSEAIRYGIERKALRENTIKLIQSNAGHELFLLNSDPAEQRNVADSQPATVEQMMGRLPAGDQISGTKAQASQSDQERLKILGYTD